MNVCPLPSSRQHVNSDDCLKDKREIIIIVLCCVVFDDSAQWYAHTYEQFLQLTVGLCTFAFCFFIWLEARFQLNIGFTFEPYARFLPIYFRQPNFTKFEHNTSIGVTMNPFWTEFWKLSRKGHFKKTQKNAFFSVLRLQAAITPQWL